MDAAAGGSGSVDGYGGGGRRRHAMAKGTAAAAVAAAVDMSSSVIRVAAGAAGGGDISDGAATSGAIAAAAAAAAAAGVATTSGAIAAAAAAAAGVAATTATAPRPVAVLPLFDSAGFDASYNRDRVSVTLPTPPGIRAAAVVSYITGHGSDAAASCGEFCPTSHHLFVNGREIDVLNFTQAGTAWGCADAVLYGSVPNQHGTWFYGRGGWCDGAAVDPWVVDVTDALRPPGSAANNTIWIKGLYGDQLEPTDPPPGTMAGYIMMQTLLVLYG